MHIAAKGGYADIVELLLNYGGDPNLRDKNGYSSSYFAHLKGLKEVTSILPAPLKHNTENYTNFREQYLRVHDITDRRKGKKKKASGKKR